MAGVSDEEWAAMKLRKEQFQKLAKNPTPNTTIYRMQGGPGDSLGVHWTTDQNVAHYTGLGGSDEERTVHRAVVDPDQIISQGEWMGGNIRSHYTDNGEFKTGKSQWGFDNEAEVRLRPGTTVRDHAIAPQGVHDYTPTGREPTIEARGSLDYVDLAHHAVQGTPEANRLHQEQGKLPHIQQALFDPVVANEGERSGQTIGYTPKWGLIRGGMGSLSEAIDFSTNDVERIGKGAGLGEWGASTESAHEPLLSELRHTAVSQPEPEPTHRRVANQMQFEGF
jgi:hypothetical protein